MKRRHAMPFGAECIAGGVRFRLWAPAAAHVDLRLEPGGVQRMQALADGWHERVQPGAGAGTRYAFEIDGLRVPDPASRCNPDDVHGPSQVIDPEAFEWRDGGWRGRRWEEAVVYELHVGAFTRQGTFAAALGRLDELAALGVTAIELMPVADFPGARNWGYDGVLLFAPDARYGAPDDLKRLIDGAHARGMMVLLDVVYNHFGPEGNYLGHYAPQFFTERHHTPWGAAINFDGPGSGQVRQFYLHNALYWIEEFHFDGLRLDAVHAIVDHSPVHIVREIAETVRRSAAGREVHLVLENDANRARWLERDARGRPVVADAQWNDDVHHALHVAVTGETDGYYGDYADRPLERIGRCLAEGFAYQGEPSEFRGGEPRGEPSGGLPPTAFVACTQTHDQVGNRAFGERLWQLGTPQAVRQAIAAVLLSPAVPMLFMGEEFAASAPFLFFCDFGRDLADAVTRGRRAEFGRFARFRDPALQATIPDPNAQATFEASRLDWDERTRPPHAEWLAFYRGLLHTRAEWIVPRLDATGRGGTYRIEGKVLAVDWELRGGARLHFVANFGGPCDLAAPPGTVIHRQCAAEPDGPARMRLERHGLVVTVE